MAIAVAPEELLLARVQELTGRVDELTDPQVREFVDELAAAIVQLYGTGLERIFAALARDGAGAQEIRAQLGEDGVVSSLMLIHGLYPVDLETRVREALDGIRPYLESHGGDVRLLAIEDGIAKLEMTGSCSSCSASQATLEVAVEQALREHAPDLQGMDVEGVLPNPPVRPSPSTASRYAWTELSNVAGLARGALTVAPPDLIVANVAGTLLAYRGMCAGCGASLADAELVGGELTCAICERHYDLPRAGRCKDDAALQLVPVPLLRDNGTVRVAVGS